MNLIGLAALAALLIIALTTVLNVLTFPRLRRISPPRPGASLSGDTPPGGWPRVSVLIPARDEAEVIGATVARLLRQDYPDYEVIVLDDGSSDGTAACALAAANGDPRLRVVSGEALPPGWLGKNWACQQLAQQAAGEALVFSDADVSWEAGALAAVIAGMERHRAGMFTVWPTQEAVTWAERLVVPLLMFVIFGYLPEVLVRFAPWAAFAAANGQCIAFWREAYTALGGHAAVRAQVVEDVALARRTKQARRRLVMAEGGGLVHGRMYANWPDVRDGFAKNILAGHGGRPALLLLSWAAHWGLFLLPWGWLALGWLWPGAGWPLLPLALVSLGLGARLLSAAASGARLRDALLLPISVLLMSAIAARALWWHYTQGGPLWKGRRVGKAVASDG